jgi:zinc and cadmium transporter
MSSLLWIILGGIVMSAIALTGSITLVLPERTLQRIILPLVAFAAGSLIGGALFHMLPAAVVEFDDAASLFAWVAVGFASFLALEQFLHWHHCHRAQADCRQPFGYMILIGDGLHNFLGGLAIGGTFLVDIRLGVAAWLAAAAHEVPQELGDFGVLVHAGWSKSTALALNFVSGLTFLLGGLAAYGASFHIDVAFLLPLAAGNFLYIGASDLVPEIKHHESGTPNAILFVAFAAGLGLLWVLAAILG